MYSITSHFGDNQEDKLFPGLHIYITPFCSCEIWAHCVLWITIWTLIYIYIYIYIYILALNTILVCTRFLNLLLYKHLCSFFCVIIRLESSGFDCWSLFAASSRIFPPWTKADKTSIYFHRIFLIPFVVLRTKTLLVYSTVYFESQ